MREQMNPRIVKKNFAVQTSVEERMCNENLLDAVFGSALELVPQKRRDDFILYLREAIRQEIEDAI